MGTLIPMGPALIGLSGGDIKSMADNPVIAFATTVIGLELEEYVMESWSSSPDGTGRI